MATLLIEYRESPELARTLLDLSKLGARLGPLHRRMGVAVLAWVDQAFQRGGPPGQPWAPLRPNTVANRRKGSSLPLRDTGVHIRNTFRVAADGNQVSVGSPSEVARMHHEGRSGPWSIRAKNGGALAFRVAGLGGNVVRGRDGSYSRIRAVQIFDAKGRRLKRARFLTGPDLTATPGTNLMVAREVHHPGYPARRMLPTEAEVFRQIRIQDIARDYLQEVIDGRGQG